MSIRCPHCGRLHVPPEHPGIVPCEQCGEYGCRECSKMVEITSEPNESKLRYAHRGECAEAVDVRKAMGSRHWTVHNEGDVLVARLHDSQGVFQAEGQGATEGEAKAAAWRNFVGT